MVGLSGLRNRFSTATLFVIFFLAGPVIKLGAAQTADAPSQTIAQKIAASKDLLDINTATAEQLKALPGMGDAYIARIIAGRPYTAKNQLVTRGVIPQAAYEKVKDQIIAHRPKP
jgi:DNA uptake protein ComE-like DNA-binding protein